MSEALHRSLIDAQVAVTRFGDAVLARTGDRKKRWQELAAARVAVAEQSEVPSIAQALDQLHNTYTPPWEPDQIAGLAGWFDAMVPETLVMSETGAVPEVRNRIPGGLSLVAPAGLEPQYTQINAIANDRPAVVFGDGGGALELPNGAAAPLQHLFIVTAYKDGQTAVFDDFNNLINTTNGPVMGYSGRATLRTHSSFLTNEVSLNGAAETSVVLPMPLSVIHIDEPMGFENIGLSGTGRTWEGPFCEALAYAAPLTDDEVARINSYLMNKWGIT